MRILLGMILGAALTVGGAYAVDTMRGAPNGSAATEQRRMVNWDVVDAAWQTLKVRARTEWNRLSAG